MTMLLRASGLLAPLLLLAGCGQDPAPTAAGAASGAPVTAPVPAAPVGLALVEDAARTKAAGNGAAKCNIETLAGKPMDGVMANVPAADGTSLVGWYADVDAKTAGGNLSLVIHDQDQKRHWTVAIPERTKRPDVDTSLQGNGALEATGFSVKVDFSKLPAGFYGAYLEGTGGICGLGRTFEIR